MRRRWVKVVLIVVGVFALIQLPAFRVTHPTERGDPPWNSPETKKLVVAACYDCHSNQTKTYWYENIAPVSWWVYKHVEDGRRAMNFSTYHRLGIPFGDAEDTVQNGSMPPAYYTWLGLHSKAKLTPAQRKALVDGLRATAARATGSG